MIALWLLAISFASTVTGKLQCYQCGVSDSISEPLSCKEFNTTSRFITECKPDHRACLKGWITDDQSEYRGCTRIAEDICLLQEDGGACSCPSSLCNASQVVRLKSALIGISLVLQISAAIILWSRWT